MRIAIAGGTGVVGHRAVQAARAQGHEVVVLSRSEGIDVLSGDGLEERLEGVDVVVNALNTTSLSLRRAAEFFRTTSRHLLEAGARQGVAHHVVLSIVGGPSPRGRWASTSSGPRSRPGRSRAGTSSAPRSTRSLT